MKSCRLILVLLAACPAALFAQPSLTIYNQNFAVVRDRVPLDLKAGENVVPYAGVTSQLEPDSVVLRDPTGKIVLRILDQGYRVDTLSQGYLLSLNEGKTLDFIVKDKDKKEYIVKGKIVRSGYVSSQRYDPYSGYNRGQANDTPIIEVNGQLRFSLPGEPVFPALGDGALLKPTLTWRIGADAPAKLDAELSYLTNGLSWKAAYNFVAPEKGDTLDLVGWVTFENNSGKEFQDAKVKLMAGNVNKIQDDDRTLQRAYAPGASTAMMPPSPPVTEKTLDEFHLYTLTMPVTMHDGETKQVQFIQASGIKAKTIYVYDGLARDRYWDAGEFNTDPNYGTRSNKKIGVWREFKNSKENGLGIALPAGRARFYRRDEADNSVQFVGENTLDHTPADELVRLYTGDSFDLVGERKRTDFQADERNKRVEEAFEIKLRNHKAEPVEIRVIEHLYRWSNWNIIQKSDAFEKTDAQTIEFRIMLKPDAEKTLTYRVQYNLNSANDQPPPANGGGNASNSGRFGLNSMP